MRRLICRAITVFIPKHPKGLTSAEDMEKLESEFCFGLFFWQSDMTAVFVFRHVNARYNISSLYLFFKPNFYCNNQQGNGFEFGRMYDMKDMEHMIEWITMSGRVYLMDFDITKRLMFTVI